MKNEIIEIKNIQEFLLNIILFDLKVPEEKLSFSDLSRDELDKLKDIYSNL